MNFKDAPTRRINDGHRPHAEVEQLRYERRLLGVARRTLDLVAAGNAGRWDEVHRDAEDVAQRIVDEIGHPVTDEPALGPDMRAQLAEIRSLVEGWDEQVDGPDAADFFVRLRPILGIDQPE